jgi:hypothetical protein
MSKPRRSGMRRAYLKKQSYTYDKSPGVGFPDENQQQHNLKDAIGLGRDINPITATPRRAMLWLSKNRHTPTMTEPMAQLVKSESWNHSIKKETWNMQTCIDSPLLRIRVYFNGFTDKSVYYFQMTDRLSGVERESFTMTKDKALTIKANGLKGIPWK